MGVTGAAGFHTLTTETEDLDLQQWAAKWDDLSNPKGPMACTYTSTVADIKNELEKLCSYQQGVCTVQVQQAIDSIAAKFSAVKTKAESLSVKGKKP